ncbi:IS1634 family transposase [Kribbella sp. VKM Ac-2568]|uniref:IS1634 family transposase n=1 Tax=Kribbella sp. VKM Ac-2568 TaxID=2512219 RepID=UPI00104B641A|nr:IS1634 family transposase [Kribbella sp. VKM Ac-2568]TCM33099.1 transposase [Kribbella sp. VKM Ac-2568]
MYVKRTTVRRGETSYVYLRLVEAYRDGGKVRHRVVANLGREDELKASGQLEQLAAGFARLDPPPWGTRREVGPLLLVRHYLDRLGLVKLVDGVIPQRGKAQLTHGEVVTALVANRLAAPAPLYDIAGWASGAAVHELLGVPGMLLHDDRLGRALEAFAPMAETVRGAAMLAALDTFGAEAARLHLDLTTLTVAGEYADSSLVARGWNSSRRIERQVRVLSAANPTGVPLYTRPFPGDASELTCVGEAMERLTQLLPPGLLIVADSALGHIKNLCEADRAGLRFIVPLRANTGFAQRFLDDVGHEGLHPIRYVSHREAHLPATQRTHYRGALRDLEVTDPETGRQRTFRVAYIWSSEEATSVAEARERALTKAETALTKITNGLGGRHYKTRKQVDAKVARILADPRLQPLLTVTTGTRGGKPTLTWQRNQTAIDTAARTDGVYALATNLPGRISATSVLHTYKDQHLVELTHRANKNTLKVRPIFLHNDDRIAALVSIVGLALLLYGLIETDLRHALGPDQHLPGLLPEGRAARPTGRNILAAFQGLSATYTPNGLRLDRLTTTQRRILDLLAIELPWPEHDEQ